MITLKCNNCQTLNSFVDDDLSIELESTEERSMGQENYYCGELVSNCSECNNKISVVVEFWEYPIGTLNTTDIKPEGSSVYEEPDFDSFLTNLL